MNEKYMISIFKIIEYLTKSELTITSKQLITSYLKESKHDKHADMARAAIQRYTQNRIPSLESIREKSQRQTLEALDHLILKMEYEARKQDEFDSVNNTV
jgi:hypothetical protein